MGFLRKKLRSIESDLLIQARRGLGYQILVAEEEGGC